MKRSKIKVLFEGTGFSIGMLTLLLCLFSSEKSAAQAIKHSYRFFNNLNASEPDCGPALVPAQAAGTCGAGAASGSFISDTLPYCEKRRPVYHSNMHWGLTYPNTTSAITNTYTIQLYVKVTNWGSANRVRIIDFFPNNTFDRGIYFTRNTATQYCLDFSANGTVGPCPAFDNQTYYLLTFTRDDVTKMIDIYVNNVWFHSYNDAANDYVAQAGSPIYIFRDDQFIACESGEANFAYSSLTNMYSSQQQVDSVYQNLCTIANSSTADFTTSTDLVCTPAEQLTVTYNGNIPAPGTGYTFNWNWDGGNIISGSGIGPYVIQWASSGVKNIGLTITGGTCQPLITETKQVTVGDLAVSATATVASCTTDNKSTLTALATGGTAPYQYSVDGTDYQPSNIFSLDSGRYTVYVRDANDCIARTNIIVPGINDAQIQTIADTGICLSESVQLFTTTNATSVSWGPGIWLNAYDVKDPIASPQSTMTYYVTGIYGSCVKRDTVTITVHEPLDLNITIENAGCDRQMGAIIANPTAGFPPYQYSLDGVTYTGANRFSVPSGNHIIYVKDQSGCVSSSIVTVRFEIDITLKTVDDIRSCGNVPHTLTTVSNANFFSWRPGTGLNDYFAKSPVATVNKTTTFIVRGDLGTCVLEDTVTIYVDDPVISAVNTKPETCSGNNDGSLTIEADGGTGTLLYSIDNINYQASNTFPLAPGTYTVYVKDEQNCVASGTATIAEGVQLFVNTINDTVVCDNNPIRLTTSSNGSSFAWTPANGLDNASVKDPMASPAASTLYYVTATTGACTATDSVRIRRSTPITVITSKDAKIAANTPYQLWAYSPELAGVTSGITYNWQPPNGLNNTAIDSPVAIVESDQVYTIEITSPDGCKGRATVKLQVFKGPDIYVPSAFSPNGDSKNDLFKPIYIGMKTLNSFKVFNRWGQQIFSTNSLETGWDGRQAGKDQLPGIYVWMVEGVSQQGTIIRKKGTVMLVR